MPLQFEINIFPAKNIRQQLGLPARRFHAALRQGRAHGTFVSARKANQAGGMRGNFRHAGGAFALAALAQFVAGDEPAKVLISSSRLGQQRQPPALAIFFHRDLGADVRLDPQFFCRTVKAWRAIDAVAIEQRQRRHAGFCRRRGQRLGQ